MIDHLHDIRRGLWFEKGLTMRLKIVRVVTDPQACKGCCLAGTCVLENDKYPKIVECVGDECGDFVVAPNGNFWPADEFFAVNQLRSIVVDPQELLPKGRPDSFWDPTLADPPEPGNLYPKS